MVEDAEVTPDNRVASPQLSPPKSTNTSTASDSTCFELSFECVQLPNAANTTLTRDLSFETTDTLGIGGAAKRPAAILDEDDDGLWTASTGSQPSASKRLKIEDVELADHNYDVDPETVAAYEETVRHLDRIASSQRMCSDDDSDSDTDCQLIEDAESPSPIIPQSFADLTQCFDAADAFTQELQWPDVEADATVSTLDDFDEHVAQHTVRKPPSTAQLAVPIRRCTTEQSSIVQNRQPTRISVRRTTSATGYPNPGPQRDYYNGPLPLLIADIQLLAPGLRKSVQSNYQHLFGQRFRSISCYGRLCWLGSIGTPHQPQLIRHRYALDDGTATVVLYYTHNAPARVRQAQAISQTISDLSVQRKRMPRALYTMLRDCVQEVRSRWPLQADHFRTGTAALVQGFARWSERDGRVTMTVTQLHVDEGRSRDLELAFRGNLLRLYEERYQLEDVG